MTGFRANKKLQLIEGEILALEDERRALELRALGAEVPEAERRSRYLAVADAGLRGKLIATSRALHDLQARQRNAAVEYWQTIAGETRDQLVDLRSGSLFSRWRRAIWWDVLTLLWIFAGAGWLAYRIPGFLTGSAITAAAAVYVVRRRDTMRVSAIRQGEDLLRSSEAQLRDARAEVERAAGAPAPFSAAEEAGSAPDAN